MAIEVIKYVPTMAQQWDEMVKRGRNATFLHMRGYMDYHSDRFTDNSLIFVRKGAIVALLPANRRDNTLYSHQGLTYGGLLTASTHFNTSDMLQVGDSLVEYMKGEGIDTLVYKPVPHIYHSLPAEEDIYLMHRLGATLHTSAISSTVDLSQPLMFNENARRAVKYALTHEVTVEESQDYEAYWRILNEVLAERHGVKPVHTLQEILLLYNRFPHNITLHVARCQGEIVAGTVVYNTGAVAHAQYIAASPRGRELKALPLLFKQLIENHYHQNRYFDFGISTEEGGAVLNAGLEMQKYGMGGRGIVYNSYILNI